MQTRGKRESAVAKRVREPSLERDVQPELPLSLPPILPPIQVFHDRKQHFGESSTASEGEPRKATSADFLTGFGDDPQTARLEGTDEKPKVEARIRVSKPVAVKMPTIESKRAVDALTPKPAVHPVVKFEPPLVVPVLYSRRGRLIMPPAMKGSHEILVRQNTMADEEGLDRIPDDEALEAMRDVKLLVPIPVVAGLVQDERLPLNRRYCRPWTAQFLTTLARAYYAKFHASLQVNSAVRTVAFQQRLLMTNGNAAPAEGETASPHLTGQAIDLAKHGLTMTQIAWLRGYLLPLVQAGKVDVEEEFQQACFHISVYKRYVPQAAPKREIAPHRGAGSALAAAVR